MTQSNGSSPRPQGECHWSKTEQIILVGVINRVSIFTGTTSFSNKNCLVKWPDVSRLFDSALVRGGLNPANKSEAALKARFKIIKSNLATVKNALENLFYEFREMNRENGFITDQDVEQLILTRQTDSNQGQLNKTSILRRNSWTLEQEQVFYGVIHYFMTCRGSIHPSEVVTAPWDNIKNCFELWFKAFVPDQALPDRSSSSLKRHYKEMRARMVGPQGNALFLKEMYEGFAEMMTIKMNPKQIIKKK